MRKPFYAWLCRSPITMNSDSIISNSDVLESLQYEIRLTYNMRIVMFHIYICMYIYMDILNGVGFYGHYAFYRLLSIHCFRISKMHSLSVTILTMSFYEVCCIVSHECFMYLSLYMLCQKWRNKDVQSIVKGHPVDFILLSFIWQYTGDICTMQFTDAFIHLLNKQWL